MSDEFSPVVYLIKSVMCKLILTKKYFRSLNVYEIEVSLPSPLKEDCFRENTSEKGCYSLIIHAYFLVVNNWYALRIVPTHVLRMDNLTFQAKVLYGDCISLVKKANVNSKNKQDPENNIPFQRFFFLKEYSVKGLGRKISISLTIKHLKLFLVKINLHITDLIK
jgi:hypothetical protein